MGRGGGRRGGDPGEGPGVPGSGLRGSALPGPGPVGPAPGGRPGSGGSRLRPGCGREHRPGGEGRLGVGGGGVGRRLPRYPGGDPGGGRPRRHRRAPPSPGPRGRGAPRHRLGAAGCHQNPTGRGREISLVMDVDLFERWALLHFLRKRPPLPTPSSPSARTATSWSSARLPEFEARAWGGAGVEGTPRGCPWGPWSWSVEEQGRDQEGETGGSGTGFWRRGLFAGPG
jgi:hypothetical protein